MDSEIKYQNLVGAIRELYQKKITSTDLLVYTFILEHGNVSPKDIQKKLKITPKTYQRSIKKLIGTELATDGAAIQLNIKDKIKEFVYFDIT